MVDGDASSRRMMQGQEVPQGVLAQSRRARGFGLTLQDMSAHALDSPLPIGAEPASSVGSGSRVTGSQTGPVASDHASGQAHPGRPSIAQSIGGTPMASQGTTGADARADLDSLDGVGSRGVAPLAVGLHRVGSDVSSMRSPDGSTGGAADGATVLTFGTVEEEDRRDRGSIGSPVGQGGSGFRSTSGDGPGHGGSTVGDRSVGEAGDTRHIEELLEGGRPAAIRPSRRDRNRSDASPQSPSSPDPAVGRAAKCLGQGDSEGAALAWS